MPNQGRSHYRIYGKLPAGVQVDVFLGRDRVPALILDISASGAALVFPEGVGPEDPEADREPDAIRMRIVSSKLPQPMLLAARSVHTRAYGDGLLVGVSFRNASQGRRQLESALLKVFNRRGALREEPPQGRVIPVSVRVPEGGELLRCALKDLSLTGLGAILPKEDARVLQVGQELQLSFSLPDFGAVELPAELRNLRQAPPDPLDRSAGPRMVCGFEFDVAASVKPRVARVLCGWIMARHREANGRKSA